MIIDFQASKEQGFPSLRVLLSNLSGPFSVLEASLTIVLRLSILQDRN